MKVIILHGWGASSKDNWFPWLKSQLNAVAPDLPNSQYPKLDDWLNAALELKPDEETILVGHSLGTILIMKLLEQIKVKAAFLVAGFDEHLGIEEIKKFFEGPFDYEKIKNNCNNIVMLSSDNDPYIPLDIAKRLSKNLECELKIFHNKDHLSSGTENFKFPELLQMINETSKKN